MEIDKNCIKNAIRGTKQLCSAIVGQLESDDEFKMQMGWNMASALAKFAGIMADIYSPYLKTGMHLKENPDVVYYGKKAVKPHPIYVWDDEEDEQETEPSKSKIPDGLKRILREMLDEA